MNIGEIAIPFVDEFTVDALNKPSEVVKHLGGTPHHVAEFKADINSLAVSGTLMQQSGTVKTLEHLAEDFVTLAQRFAPYNFVYAFQGRTGWCSVDETSAPEIADSPIIRVCTLSGLFLDDTQYQARMHTSPAIRSNPWSHVLGTDDCDNYVAIPIGATYSGGDGSTISRSGEDGTITLVLATSLKDIKYDIAEDDVDNGEVKILDEMGEALEADWVKVFNRSHRFTGKTVIQNSLYRIILDPATEYLTLYRYSSGWVKIDDFTSSAFNRVWLTTSNSDKVVCKLSNDDEITIRRGHPILIDTGTTDLVAVALTPADQSTSTDNYLSLGTNIYICSDANFSIVNSTKNLDDGKKWIFYETDAGTGEDIAHQALVDQKLIRELVAR